MYREALNSSCSVDEGSVARLQFVASLGHSSRPEGSCCLELLPGLVQAGNPNIFLVDLSLEMNVGLGLGLAAFSSRR